ncbi:maltose acetyltransferase domain-containing protein [Bacillus altitudinis]
MKTEKEKMIKGEYYHPNDHTLMKDRAKARQLTFAYQQTNEPSQRKAILKELLGA